MQRQQRQEERNRIPPWWGSQLSAPANPPPATTTARGTTKRAGRAGSDQRTVVSQHGNNARDTITQPSEDDIILGRGVLHVEKTGNRRYYELLDVHLPQYEAADSKGAKTKIVRTIYQQLQLRGARFLRKTKDGRYFAINPKQAKKKISHAIRYRKRPPQGEDEDDDDEYRQGTERQHDDTSRDRSSMDDQQDIPPMPRIAEVNLPEALAFPQEFVGGPPPPPPPDNNNNNSSTSQGAVPQNIAFRGDNNAMDEDVFNSFRTSQYLEYLAADMPPLPQPSTSFPMQQQPPPPPAPSSSTATSASFPRAALSSSQPPRQQALPQQQEPPPVDPTSPFTFTGFGNTMNANGGASFPPGLADGSTVASSPMFQPPRQLQQDSQQQQQVDPTLSFTLPGSEINMNTNGGASFLPGVTDGTVSFSTFSQQPDHTQQQPPWPPQQLHQQPTPYQAQPPLPARSLMNGRILSADSQSYRNNRSSASSVSSGLFPGDELEQVLAVDEDDGPPSFPV